MTSRPVGLSRDLPAKRVMRAEADGHDIVVWRASDGTIAAWDNRCPHRGMALSHGFVRGNSLACLYHGWHYGASGVCRYIPAHPDLDPPETIHAVRYGVTERDGVIWVAPHGNAEDGATSSAFEPLRSLIVDASEEAVRVACTATPFEGMLPIAGDNGHLTLSESALEVLCNPRPQGTQVTFLCHPDLSVPRRKALSRWCEAMRRAAEQEETA